ncbi:hypothetical protein HGM15179_012195 [Zosterops borbonicus]|uniref:Uncharacterized protein n=1 Tax=Zosterops borbonicus TaxID=364589 RepID=A0A8K1LIJ0_9PASS|nr:hypothetical protein HGM15179_012195 [Zosterops borbonicus]
MDSIIYHQPWLTGEVPDEWKLANVTPMLANVTPIHKNGWKGDPGNYQPDQPDLSAQQGCTISAPFYDFSS